MANCSRRQPKAPFSIATTPRCKGGCYFFPWIAPLTLHLFLIMLSVKQGHIKHHFLSLWYDSMWDWILVSWTIGKHSNHFANLQCFSIKLNYKSINSSQLFYSIKKKFCWGQTEFNSRGESWHLLRKRYQIWIQNYKLTLLHLIDLEYVRVCI